MGTRPRPRGFLFLAVALLGNAPLLAQSTGMVNPHGDKEACLSCHRERPAPGASRGEAILLGNSIDATCQICHPYDCCRVHALKGHNHPSDVGKWDVKQFSPPRELPLFGGKITCTTCHLNHPREGKDSYALLRIVSVRLDRVDWTALCRDCHRDY